MKIAKLGGRQLLFLDCDGCGARVLFADETVIYPDPLPAVPEPNGDLKEDIRRDYWEAARIVRHSPRGACALLRLCLMQVMQQLELSGDLNEDIRELVKRGLDAQVQEACDVVRVVGNGAVHPGKIDVRDDPDTAGRLFELVNFIADQMITQPRKRAAFFQKKVPDSTKSEIDKRNVKARSGNLKV